MRILVFLFALLIGLGPAVAQERHALVIGNSAYQSLGALANPANDARLIAGELQKLGFETDLLVDADENRMKRAILDLGKRLRRAGPDAVGLFYFAGHGIQASGSNFLVPVRVNVSDAADLEIEAVKADWVLSQMESAQNAVNIVILDACRNNPFARSVRSIDRGLARMSAPPGSFIAYATAPGDVAADGSGRNSPYSAALARRLAEPGVQIEQVFKQVRVDVIRETGGNQTPWDSSSMTRDFYFNGGAGSAIASGGGGGGGSGETAMWRKVRDSGDEGQLELFLDLYPDSRHAGEARQLLAAARGSGGGAAVSGGTDSGGDSGGGLLSGIFGSGRGNTGTDDGGTAGSGSGGGGAVASLPPATGGGGTVLLNLTIGWTRYKDNRCLDQNLTKPAKVPLGPGRDPVRAQGGRYAHELTAEMRGSDLVVTVRPFVRADLDIDPIEVVIRDPAPGRSGETQSRERMMDEFNRCGLITAYVGIPR